ncbi:MAG: hypothetical protein H7248_08365 [Microbacteriaceae bacterium]|nr:hypothetical protein [Microbacteriaceae bacterium]
MTGTLPLHSAVIMPCACCLLPTSFTFSSVSDQAVCSHCVNHLSRVERREVDHLARWTATLTAQRTELQSLQQSTDREAAAQRGVNAKLAASVAELIKSISDPDAAAPPLPVRALVQSALIAAAESKRDRALKYRDIAMAALFKLAELHTTGAAGTAAVETAAVETRTARAATAARTTAARTGAARTGAAGTATDRCRCGKKATDCADLSILDGVRGALLSWKASH